MGKFIFSAWRSIEMDRTWDTMAQDFYDLGLTLPFTPIFKEGSDYAKMIKLLDDFAALGMKVIMCDDRVTARREPVLDEEDYRARFARSLEAVSYTHLMRDMYTEGTIDPDLPISTLELAQNKFLNGQAAALCVTSSIAATPSFGMDSSWKDVYKRQPLNSNSAGEGMTILGCCLRRGLGRFLRQAGIAWG